MNYLSENQVRGENRTQLGEIVRGSLVHNQRYESDFLGLIERLVRMK